MALGTVSFVLVMASRLSSSSRRRLLATESAWHTLGDRAEAKVASDIASGARLLVVPAPLGDPSDASFRIVAALSAADVVACEDTRKAGALMASLGIVRNGQRLARHDAETAKESSEELLSEMGKGKVVALTCDAGTPCVSDPGSLLVKLASENGIKVVALPGPCAASTAISASGLDTTKGFCFVGFASGRSAQKRASELSRFLAEAETRPVVMYESPRRIKSTVEVLEALDPKRRVVVARELTKTYEDVWRGDLTECKEWISQGGAGGKEPRGEFTLVIDARSEATEGAESDESLEDLAKRRVQSKRDAGLSLSAAAKAVAAELDLKRSQVYDLALGEQLRRDNDDNS